MKHSISKKSSYSKILTISSIYCLWLSAIFDPVGGFFGIRYIALIIILISITFELIKFDDSLQGNWFYFLTLFYFSLLLPSLGLIVGLLRGGISGVQFIDTSYLASAIYFSCSLIYLNKYNLNIGLNALIFSLRLLSLAIFICLFVYLFNLSTDFIWFFVDNGVALFGDRNYGEFSFYYLYFIASPMLIFLLVFETWRFLVKPTLTGFLLTLLPAGALFLSGTRLNMLMAVFGIPFIYFWKKFGFGAIFSIFSLLIFFFILQWLFPIEILTLMFGATDVSNSAKLDYLTKYINLFSDPVTVIFGQGFNAHAWSNTFATMLGDSLIENQASKTELTYIELFRVFGIAALILFFLIMFSLIYFFNKMEYDRRWISPAIFLFLLASILNPYLFSSNGMLLLGFASASLKKYYKT